MLPRETLRVLCVEDDAEDAAVIERGLRTGFRDTEVIVRRVAHLGDVEAALAAFPLDVLLLDLTLPDGTGLETLDDVLRRAPEIPVIVLTWRDDSAEAVDALRRGAADFVWKAAEPAVLVHAVSRVLARHQLVLDRLEQTVRAERRRRELLGVSDLAEPAAGSDSILLRRQDPDRFDALGRHFDDTVMAAIKRRALQEEPDDDRTPAALADAVVDAGAAGYDVIALYVTALRERSAIGSTSAIEAWMDEARLVALETLAAVAERWRARRGGSSPQSPV